MLFKNENGKLIGDGEINALLKEGQTFITEYTDRGIENQMGIEVDKNAKYDQTVCICVEKTLEEVEQEYPEEYDKNDPDELENYLINASCELGYLANEPAEAGTGLFEVLETFKPVSNEEVEDQLHKYLINRCSFKEKSEIVETLKKQIRELFLFDAFDIEVLYEDEDEEEYSIELEFYIDYKRFDLTFEFSKNEWFGYSYENIM